MNRTVARMMELLDELQPVLQKVEADAADHVLHARFARRIGILIDELRYETDVEPRVPR